MYYVELLNEERAEELLEILSAYYGDEPVSEDWDDMNVYDAYEALFNQEYEDMGRRADNYRDKIAADAIMDLLPRNSDEFKHILESVGVGYNSVLVKPWMNEFIL